MGGSVVPGPRAVDKYWEGYIRNEGSQPHTRPPSSGFQCQENESPSLLAVKAVWGGVVEEAAGFSSNFFKGLQSLRTNADPHTLSSSTVAAAGRAKIYKEKL